MARDLLKSDGYQVIRTAGSHSPVDLVAWRSHDSLLFIQARRTRSPINRSSVAKTYQDDLAALRKIPRPHNAMIQFWLWNNRQGWRFFAVMPGGIRGMVSYEN